MARTIITDAMEKKYNGVTIKGDVKNAIQYINNGTIYNTFVTVDNLHKYNAIDDIQCVFGAKSSKNFQYSMLVKLTDYIGIYEKDCKQKEKWSCHTTPQLIFYHIFSAGSILFLYSGMIFTIYTHLSKKLNYFLKNYLFFTNYML